METYHQRDTSGRYTAFSERIVCPACQTKFLRCLEKRKNGKVAYWRCRGEHRCIHVRSIKEEWLQRMAAETMGKLEFDDTAFRAQVQRIEVQDNETLLFQFNDGHTKEVKLS